VPDFRLRLAGLLMSAASSCWALKKFDEGIRLQEEAIERVTFLTTNWPTVKQYQGVHGGILSNLASLLRQQGRDLERAEDLALQAITHQHLALASPDQPNDYLLNHYVVLAEIRVQRGRLQEARAACEEGLQVGQKLQEAFPANEVILRNVQRLREISKATTGLAPTESSRSDNSDSVSLTSGRELA
jgi:tetratricopeptide (TPR) repeat protein